MSIENIITILICAVASLYVGKMLVDAIRKLLAPGPPGACGGCSGCGTANGHADEPENCDLVQLRRK